MTVYFDNGIYERPIGNGNSVKECYTIIYDFLNEMNYKSYYNRSWEENGRIKVDVGCWSQFFYIDGKD